MSAIGHEDVVLADGAAVVGDGADVDHRQSRLVSGAMASA
jgi:hypothetical protein